jgi:hypothetical protein
VVRSDAELILENLALRHQLQIALRSHPRPRLSNRDRFLWVSIRRVFPTSWQRYLVVVRPETVISWPPQRLAEGGQKSVQLVRASAECYPAGCFHYSLLIRAVLASLRSRRDVALENLVLRHQLQVALRTNPSPRLTNPDGVLWIWLRHAWPAWRDHLHVANRQLSSAGTARVGALLDVEVTDSARMASPERRGS